MRALVVSILLTMCVVGCGSGAEPPDNPDVVATVSAQSFPFSTAKTFVLPNNVAEITDQGAQAVSLTPTQQTTLDPGTEALILNEIATQLTARGYVQLTDPVGPKPDIFVQASVMRTTSTDVYYTSWYGYWGGYYDPWYSGYYSAGWAPYSVPYVVTSTLGSLIIEFTDPNNPEPSAQKIPSVWVGVVTGAVDGASTTEVQSRVKSGIDQAFAQSPYIRSQP